MSVPLQFLVVLTFLLSVRLLGIDLFPLPHPDEGFWLSAPRNWVLFDDPFFDGRLHLFLSPVTFVLHAIGFLITGPSLLTARIVSALCGTLGALSLFLVSFERTKVRSLLPLMCGACSLLVLSNRRAMTETPQVALLCCLLGLLATRQLWKAMGVFALAVVTKVNSLIILPALLVYVWQVSGERPFLKTLTLCGAPLLFAGAVYGGLYLLYPHEFVLAFTYELDGLHFMEGNKVIHFFGRFGINPEQLRLLGRETVKSFPLLIPLALAGSWHTLRSKPISPLSKCCLIWLYGGVLFYVIQLFTPPRYLLTVLPPLAYFAVKMVLVVHEVCARRFSRKLATLLTFSLVATFIAYHSTRVALKVATLNPRSTHHALTAFAKNSMPHSARILAAPYNCIDLRQPCIDFYRALKPYGVDGSPSLSEVIAKHSITHVLVENEWRGLLPQRVPEVKAHSYCSFHLLDLTVYRTHESYQGLTQKESGRLQQLPCP